MVRLRAAQMKPINATMTASVATIHRGEIRSREIRAGGERSAKRRDSGDPEPTHADVCRTPGYFTM